VVKRNHLMWICSKKLSSLKKDNAINSMSAINQNQESDSLKIIENEDGSFAIEWDPQDPNWKFLNGLTSFEVYGRISFDKLL